MKAYQLLDDSEVDTVLALLSTEDWKQGKARTEASTGTIKKNLELGGKDGENVKIAVDTVADKLKACNPVAVAHLVAAFAAPKFNRYADGGAYDRHTDSPQMGENCRTDLACTIFLSDPASYEGGELHVQMSAGGEAVAKGPKGSCVVYDCGAPHWVTPVTEGERICAITWIQSHIRDRYKRQLVVDFRDALQNMENAGLDIDDKYRDDFTTFAATHSGLMRMWME